MCIFSVLEAMIQCNVHILSLRGNDSVQCHPNLFESQGKKERIDHREIPFDNGDRQKGRDSISTKDQ